ncbi:MAG: FtsH protease activity modulator HflK [Xanthobacteraceae bacterium]|nr:FtsH protease activity modulator HflK [Xanthobacteraceae bacterium]QYK44248.1 MAG: FtsH protease activity modulator HflK [Xanthobacteraceae bacterium]
MSWKNQSGGPWGSGPRGPWGSGPQPGPGGNQPPDLEELIRRGQDRLKSVLPGSGSFGGRGIIILLFAAVLVWLLSGFYRVNTDEQGIVLRFGRFHQTTQPGLNYHLPYPIETVLTPRVTFENKIDIGVTIVDDFRRGGRVVRDVPEESLMLTGDENIVDVDFSVFWRIKNAPDFLFKIQNPEGTIKAVAESVMREVIGGRQIQPILTGARQNIEQEVLKLMQKVLDSYEAGVLVTRVQLQKVDPPSQVIDAFRDVQAARADAERLQNEAQTYANRVVPEARGEAAKILQAAEAYRERTVVEARGEALRFLSVLEEYKKAPAVTRQRIYLETMERVLNGIDKVILENNKGGQGVVPYLPLDQLLRQQTPAGARR